MPGSIASGTSCITDIAIRSTHNNGMVCDNKIQSYIALAYAVTQECHMQQLTVAIGLSETCVQLLMLKGPCIV